MCYNTIPDLVSETIAAMQEATKVTTTDKCTTGITIETEGTNRTTSITGTTITKTEVGLTTGDAQPSTNTTETNLEHR